ncbi:hypothetical protein PMAYCL1PPCAC_28665, partial [Pristionchus mayeri]
TFLCEEEASVTIDRSLLRHAANLDKLITETGKDASDNPLPISLPRVTKETAEEMILWLEEHKDDPEWVEKKDEENKIEDIPDYDKQKFDAIDKQVLYGLIIASELLDIKGLFDSTCKIVAGKLNGKTVEEMREYLEVECDFTEEELAEIQKENEWCNS